jgi:hypothetical protein
MRLWRTVLSAAAAAMLVAVSASAEYGGVGITRPSLDSIDNGPGLRHLADNAALSASPLNPGAVTIRDAYLNSGGVSISAPQSRYILNSGHCSLTAFVGTGSITNGTLTISVLSSGALHPGLPITGSGIQPGTVITVGSGGTGSYTVNIPQNVVSTTITAYGDGGSQVPSFGGNCWLASFPATGSDPKQFGCLGNDIADDQPCLFAAFNAAIRLTVPFDLSKPPVKWKINEELIWDFNGQQSLGFEINATGGAVIDASAITSGPALQIQCGTGTTQAALACAGPNITGTLIVTSATTNNFTCLIGKSNLSDVIQNAQLDNLVCQNSSPTPGAGACQFNYMTTDVGNIRCNTQGGGGVNNAGIAAGAEIVGGTMNNLRVTAAAGECIYTGTCTNEAITIHASNVLYADPFAPADPNLSTQITTFQKNNITGGDMENCPIGVGSTSTYFFNNFVNLYINCFKGMSMSLPSIMGGFPATPTAGKTYTVTATNLSGSPSVIYTVQSGDAAADVVRGLGSLINASAAMTAGGVFAAEGGTVSGTPTLYGDPIYADLDESLGGPVIWTLTSNDPAVVSLTVTITGNVHGNIWMGRSQVAATWQELGWIYGTDMLGQGTRSWLNRPYTAAYTVSGQDYDSIISSYAAGANTSGTAHNQSRGSLSANAAALATSIAVTGAGTVVVGDNVFGLKVPNLATVASVTNGGNCATACTVGLSAGISAAMYAGMPIAFRPVSVGSSGAATLTATLPSCAQINGGQDWRVRFVSENGNPVTIAAVGSDKIISGAINTASLTFSGNYNYLVIECNGGNGWEITSASPNVLGQAGSPGNVMFLGGSAIGVNCNSTGDTIVTINSTTDYIIEDVVFVAETGTFTTAKYGLYTAAAQGGNTLIAQTALSGLTTTSVNTVTSAETNGANAHMNAATVYLNIGTAQGGTCTMNVYFYILPLQSGMLEEVPGLPMAPANDNEYADRIRRAA